MPPGARLRRIAGLAAALLAAVAGPVAMAEAPSCTDDAIIVFDASGSMSGMLRTGVRESRIDRVRRALEIILPEIERHRNLGLIVYGPVIGADLQVEPQCTNIEMRVAPQPAAAAQIISEVNNLVPSGVTPLTDAIEMAALALGYRQKPATVLLFTDGQETCGGQPCQTVRRLVSEARGLTMHVVNYAIRDPYGIQAQFGSACIAEESGGIYVPAETLEELVAAFRKALGCPLLTQADAPAGRN